MVGSSVAALRLLVPPSIETEVLDFLKGHYELHRLSDGSQATLEDYVTQVNNLQHYLDELLAHAAQPPRKLVLSDLTDTLIVGGMKWQLARNRSPETANKLRCAMVAISNFAIDELELPLKRLKVKKFKVPKRRPQCWLPDEVLKILAAAQRVRGDVGSVPAARFFFALELFILNTGTRISAVMETPSAGLDLEGGWVSIPAEVQKHDSDEVFDLLPITVAALRALAPHRNASSFDDWPFDRITRQWPTLNRWQKRIIVDSGLRPSVAEVSEKDLFHKLRRSFATFVAAKGGTHLARVMLGHSHESVTKRYLDDRMMNRPRLGDLLTEFARVEMLDRQRRLF